MARMTAKTDTGKLEAVNVMGLIPGRDAGRSIIVGAHYDHLGQRGDSIYFGADDNASGTSGVLSLAKNWSESSFIPYCNLVFAFWSAEEKGMLGSTYYVINSQLDTTNTAVYLNFDMISRKDVTDSNQVSIGLLTGTHDIERMAGEENAKLAQPFRLDLWHTSGNGGSDYVAFAKRGIPVMSFFSGFSNDYHTPRDIYEKTDPIRMKTILQLANQCLIRLALNEE
jgi:Zn-dependent M28 family amino/carboxypeptidase